MEMKVFKLFTPEEAATMLAFAEKEEFEDGKNTAHGKAKLIKENEQLSVKNPQVAKWADQIKLKFLTDPALRAYTYPQEFVGLRLNSYKPDQHYDWHVDMGIMNAVRTDMSFTTFLTPKSEYEGGVLEINHGNHIIKVKGNAGQVVVYPTGLLHRVTPVTSGRRVCFIGWIKSNVPIQEDRDALFTLTAEISRLKEAHGDKDSDKLSYVLQYMTRALAR
jgi:PKHD-type hydroxylase